MIDYKAQDEELYHAWKESKDPQALAELMRRMSPIIQVQVRRLSGTLPEAALSAEAKKWALHAIKTYDPSKGAALSTHVYSYLRKTKRLNYRFQNAAKLPEDKQLKFGQFNDAVENLKDKLLRDPTEEELAAELGWKKTHVVDFKKRLFQDVYESKTQYATGVTSFNRDKIVMDHIMTQLTPEEKLILTKSKTMSSAALAKELGVNISRLNYLKGKLVSKIKDMQMQFQVNDR